MTVPLNIVGRRVPLLEGPDKVSGRAIYAHDVQRPGMLAGAILRSPHAHARILGIDTTAARAMPGVVAVLTGADLPGLRYINAGPAYADRFPMARELVRFVGEEVAAIAAENLAQAQAALAAIVVSYAVLKPVLTTEAALKPGAPVLHQRDGLRPNVAQHSMASFGEVDAAFANAHAVFEDHFEHGVVVPACMETNAVVAEHDAATGALTIWAGTQAPFFVRKEVAHVLALAVEDVRVMPVAIGGGFGGKSQSPEPVAIAAALAIRAGRPVRIALDRREEFLAGKTDHGKTIHLRSAVDAAGNILARQVATVVDNGAYTHMGPVYVSATRARTCSHYRVGAARFEGTLAYTNRMAGGSYRGMGAPQITWAIETQIDRIAAQLGLDPLAYRIQIANRAGDTTPLGWQITSCGLVECLEEAGRRIGWAEKRASPAPHRGVGIAAMIHPSGSVLYAEGNFATIALDALPGGRILVGTMSADAGTGQNTILAQLVAEELGIGLEQIDVLHMDTARNPVDLGSAASRVTFVSGNAALAAARNLKRDVAARLALLWQVPAAEISVEGGIARWSRDNARTLSLAELVDAQGSFRVEGRFAIDLPKLDPKTGHGNYAASYAFGAQAAEVEVDPATGQVRVLRIVAVQDVGRVINPTTLEGQMQGGIVQGIGMALQEELIFEGGQPVNASFITYRVPRLRETPDIELAFIETNEALGPLGAKAAGEPSINATVAAVANAVAHATGVRFTRLPITPERVLEALSARRLEARPALRSWKRPANIEVAAVRALYPGILFPALRKTGAAFGRRKRIATPERHYPTDVAQALAALAGGDAKILAGGTDLLPGLRQGVHVASRLVDIGALRELSGITATVDGLRIGSATTLAEIVASPLVRARHPALAEGLAMVATQQIRNMATLAGDLCQQKRCWFFRSAVPCYMNGGAACPCYAITGDNRHHAIMGAGRCAAPCVADAAPILTALDARIEIAGPHGVRHLPMVKFYRWSGETHLAPTELMLAILVPQSDSVAELYEKQARWRGDFAEASVAVQLRRAARGYAPRIALGGVAPLPMRAPQTEAILAEAGPTPSAATFRAAAEATLQGALPLSDNRYKADLLVNLTERALLRAWQSAAARGS
jgi:CO/xanthine dehydrogenase Mo-binding subunit/CO/xanthine dehydrogenase FAD-binding subunit